MPELPEVEEVRRTLEPSILGRTVAGVGPYRPDFVTPPDAPLERMIGRTFVETRRHGKKLFCRLDDSQTLLFHLGMTGHLACAAAAAPLPPHTHFTLRLDDGAELRFQDPRRFGGVWYYPSLAAALAAEIDGRLGPDALAIAPSHLAAAWTRTRGRLKARLLGQRDIAGLGNIYVDEALWLARLHPLQQVARIPPARLEKLVWAIHHVLRRSIELGGTTLRDYRNAVDQPGAFRSRLNVYGRRGKTCRRCAAALACITAAGRTTVFCPACQRRR